MTTDNETEKLTLSVTEDSFEAAKYFASKCLLVHRQIPFDDVLANSFWREACHNLVWLIEDAGHPVGSDFQALSWYHSVLIGLGSASMGEYRTRGPKKKDQEKAFKALSGAIQRVFGGWSVVEDILTNKIGARGKDQVAGNALPPWAPEYLTACWIKNENSLQAAISFAQKCLWVFRNIPGQDRAATYCWNEITHKLYWLLGEVSRAEVGEALRSVTWYLNETKFLLSEDELPVGNKFTLSQEEKKMSLEFLKEALQGSFAQGVGDVWTMLSKIGSFTGETVANDNPDI